MSRAMLMGGYDATKAIGTALSNLGRGTLFQDRRFHYPGLSQDAIVYTPGKVTVLVRWDGIGEDLPTEREGIKVPSAIPFEVRLLHTTYAQNVKDEYVYAQDNLMKGTFLWFEHLSEDRSLGELVLDVGITDSFVSPLTDEISGDELYAHQMGVMVKVF